MSMSDKKGGRGSASGAVGPEALGVGADGVAAGASPAVPGGFPEAGTATAGDVAGVGRQPRVALYARVSTQLQEREATVQSQLAALRAFADRQGWRIGEDLVFMDEGYSGSSLIRPALDRLRDAVAEGRCEVTLVYDPDRLARQFAYQMLLVEELESHGTELVFVQNPLGKSPDDQMLLQVKGVIAEYERAKIAERTRRGKQHRMQQGELVTGRRTFGYAYFGKTSQAPAHFRIIEEEAVVIRQIFTTFVEEGLSLRAVARRLNEQGLRTIRGKPWRGSNLHQILRNHQYTGTGYAHRVEAVLPRQKPLETVYRKYAKTGKRERPREQWLPFSCPAIVSEELFELARQRLETNRHLAARHTKHDYLLRGLVECGHCHRRMQAHTRTARYVCTYTRRQAAAETTGACCENRARPSIRELDALVWDEAAKLIRKPSLLRRQYRQLQARTVPRVAAEPEALERKQAKLHEQMRRNNKLFIEGISSETEHRQNHRQFQDQLHRVQLQLQKVKEDSLEDAEIEQMLASFRQFSTAIRSGLDEADFATKRSIIENLVKRVIVEKSAVSIEFAVPLERNTLCPTNREW